MDISGPVKADSKKEGLSPLFYFMLFLFLIFLYEVRCFFKTFAVCSDSAIATIYCYLDRLINKLPESMYICQPICTIRQLMNGHG